MSQEIEITPEIQEVIDKKVAEVKVEFTNKFNDAKAKIDEVAENKAIVIANEMFEKEKTTTLAMKEYNDQKEQLIWLSEQKALPKDETPWQTLMKLRLWKQMWMTEYEAINWIAFVNGRMSIWWEVMMWMIAKAWYKIEFVKSDDKVCRVKITDRKTWESAEDEYTIEEAKKSWLYPAKDYSPWMKYTKLMLRYKAVRQISKFFCPQVLWWMITAEEAQTELAPIKEDIKDAEVETDGLIEKIQACENVKELQELAPEIKQAGSKEILATYSAKIQELWSK